MSKSRNRITITLTDDVYDAISRISDLSNKSKASVASDLVNGVGVPLKRTVLLMEAASRAPEELIESLQGRINDTQMSLEGMLKGVDIMQDHLRSELQGGTK